MLDLQISQHRVDELSADARSELIQLCSAAYEADFSRIFDVLPDTTHLFGRRDGVLVAHVAWVTRWLQPAGLPILQTAYIEAVATAPAHQGRGYASLLLREAAKRFHAYDLGALSPSEEGFYARLGWELWRGPLAIRTATGLIETPADEQVMILRLPRTPSLDLSALLTAEWRRGALW